VKPTAVFHLAAAAIAAALALPAMSEAAAPSVSTAPGRVVFAVDGGARQSNIDAGGAGFAVALADGKALLLGSTSPADRSLRAARIDRNGALDPTFGSGGIASLPAQTNVLQVLRQPDGKLLLVAGDVPGTTSPSAPLRLKVTRLNADFSIDASFGAGGTVVTPINEGCGACTTAALQPDGAIVLTGTTGTITSPTAPNLRWAVARLTPAGALDASFGTGGVATIPTAASTSGFNVAVGPGGTIVSSAQSQPDLLSGESTLLLARLTPDGSLDSSFGGGDVVTTPLSTGFLTLVLADGSVVMGGQPQRELPVRPGAALSRQLLVRYTPGGALDGSFGSGGVVDLGTADDPRQLLPAAGRAVTVVATPAFVQMPGSFPRPGGLSVRTVGANGSVPPARVIALPFGGGGSSFVVSIKPRPVAEIVQNSFGGTRLVPRPDGSYLVPGGVSVTQPTGEGSGYSIGRFAAAGLTSSLELDPSFGGPAAPLRLSVRLSRQRARTAFKRHGIRIELKASAVGLARVKILAGRRAIAHSLLPVFTTARHVLPVELTKYGNLYLRRHRNVRVTISATGRDLLTTTRTATARGRLR
jgi:uncharacterized delta-60 repeat protein